MNIGIGKTQFGVASKTQACTRSSKPLFLPVFEKLVIVPSDSHQSLGIYITKALIVSMVELRTHSGNKKESSVSLRFPSMIFLLQF